MGGSRRGWVVAVVALAVAGAWQYRDRLKAALQPPVASAEHPMAQPDVLYSWVDRDGVTHFEQQSGQGQRVEYDGSRITPAAPVDPELADKVRKAAGTDDPAGGAPGDAAGGATGTLHGLRQELQSKARRMQGARSAGQDL